MDQLPRLRALEILQLDEDDGPSFLLRDPQGYSDAELVLSEAALFVAAHLDGEHDLEQVLDGYRRRYGKTPAAEEIHALVARLEEAAMLESNAFERFRREREEAFAKASTRPPAHAGSAYPEDPEEARQAVAGYFRAAEGLEEEGPRPEGTLRGLVAPHIDLRVGGGATALAWRLVEETPAVRTVIVLGTSHACPRPAWIATDKPFETPLGPAPVDREACRRLLENPNTESGAGDLFLHRKEHSIEFQALLLAALRERGRDLAMVPVLCGSFGGESPPDLQDDPFLLTLRGLIEDRGESAVILAAADLAHVGPRFGDSGALDEEGLAALEEQDRRTLAAVADGDPGAFFTSVTEDDDPRRICGLSAIYAALAVLPHARGKVLRYEQATDPTGTVSYAAAGLWAP